MIARRATLGVSATLYNIAWATDTHASAVGEPDKVEPLYRQSAWAAENLAAYKIAAAIHTGDTFNGGQCWVGSPEAFRNIACPKMATIGNHDYTNLATRSVSGWANAFPTSSMSGIQGTFSGTGEDSWHLVDIGGTQWGVLMLGFGAQTAVLEWASGILAANSTTPFIVATHAYLCKHDGRFNNAVYGTGQVDNPHAYFDPLGTECNDGEEMWTKLIRDAGNVGIVLSGHDPLSHAYLASARSSSAMFPVCHQIMHDHQWQQMTASPAYNGNPYLGLLGIDETNNLLCLQLLSPSTMLDERKVAAGFQVPLIVSP